MNAALKVSAIVPPPAPPVKTEGPEMPLPPPPPPPPPPKPPKIEGIQPKQNTVLMVVYGLVCAVIGGFFTISIKNLFDN